MIYLIISNKLPTQPSLWSSETASILSNAKRRTAKQKLATRIQIILALICVGKSRQKNQFHISFKVECYIVTTCLTSVLKAILTKYLYTVLLSSSYKDKIYMNTTKYLEYMSILLAYQAFNCSHFHSILENILVTSTHARKKLNER